MQRSKKHIRFLSFFFLTIFLFYCGGITLFSHSHVVNGSVVVHSHLYKGNHAHTVKTFQTIFYLSVIQSFGDPPSLPIPDVWFSLIMIIPVPALCDTLQTVMPGTLQLRAPPALFLF